jgi:serine/threonine protein kinase
MSLPAGTRLGTYEIVALIGAGGMGEVYRAKDTKLGRDVALKILPASFTNDPERVARFRREAQVLASLNHSHIAQIYGMEEANGTQFLVLELVDGESLDKRIARGRIPVDDALAIAEQLAEALEAAHDRGIIHRDLKPANIALTKDGNVKVLDFGLAKAVEPTTGSVDAMNSPTITSPAMMTGVGVILGTAAYMSPEQAKGRPADKRSDVWAFGCVLYEMLTGRRAFAGEDVSDTLALVLTRDLNWPALPTNTPASIRRMLRRCLEKDRKRRLADIADTRLEIADARREPEPASQLAPAPATQRGHWARSTVAALVAMVFVSALVPAVLYVRRAVPESVVTRLDINTPPTTDAFSFALSPDGRQMAFVADGEKGSQLWLRPLDKVAAQPLAGTEGASYPFWAPDSRAIGFFADGRLKRTDLTGGAPQVLADAPNGRGGTWNSEGVIVFTPALNSGLMRVMATGGVPSTVTRLTPGQSSSHRWPHFLPGGRRVLFLTTLGQPHTNAVYVASLDGGEPTRVVTSEAEAEFAPPGYLLRVSQGMLVAQPFDAAHSTVAGQPIPLAHAVGTSDGFRSAFSVSAAGVLAHRVGAWARRQLVWVDRLGKVQRTLGLPDENGLANPALAPSGERVAVSRVVQGNADVWLIDAGRGVPSRFTFDAGLDLFPVWSTDGRQVVFASTRKGILDLFEKPANDAATDEQPLLVTSQDKSPLDWSSDGRVLLYATQDPKKTTSELWALPLTGERQAFPIVQSSFDNIQGQLSPDGRWLAYASNESGRYEIYVQSFPGQSDKHQVSTAGGTQPRWRRDGTGLFYVAPDNRLMAVPVHVASDGHVTEPGVSVALFPTRLASGQSVYAAGFNARAQYAVASDGRFLMNVNVDDATPAPPITIVQNWQEELKQRVPTK